MTELPFPRWDSVRLAVFDLDGTLYNQRAMRVMMALELSTMVFFSEFKEIIKVLSNFRNLRENLAQASLSNDMDEQFAKLACMTSIPVDRIKCIVEEWMFFRPLKYLRFMKFSNVNLLFNTLFLKGIHVAVLSDLPVKDKLQHLGIVPNYSACTHDFGEFKPGTKTLLSILDFFGVKPVNVFVFGDRPERDGVMAKNAGCRYIKVNCNRDFLYLLNHFN